MSKKTESKDAEGMGWIVPAGITLGAATVGYLIYRVVSEAQPQKEVQRKAMATASASASGSTPPVHPAPKPAASPVVKASVVDSGATTATDSPSATLVSWLQSSEPDSAAAKAAAAAMAPPDKSAKPASTPDAGTTPGAPVAGGASNTPLKTSNAAGANTPEPKGKPNPKPKSTSKSKPKPKAKAKPTETPATKKANEAKRLYVASDFSGAHKAFTESIELIKAEAEAEDTTADADVDVETDAKAAAARKNQLRTAYFNRGRACQNLNDVQNALDDFKLALREDPTYQKARMRLAECHQALASAITADWGSEPHKQKVEHQRAALVAHTYIMNECIASGQLKDLPSGTERVLEQLVGSLGKTHARQIRESANTAGSESQHRLPSNSLTVAFLESFCDPPCKPESRTVQALSAALEEVDDGDDAARAELLLARGLAHKQVKQFAKAEADFAAAAALGPDCQEEMYPLVMNEYGTFLHLKGDYAGAREALGTSAKLRPELVNTLIKLGGVAFDSEDPDLALKHFNKAASILVNGRPSADAFFHRGQMFLINEKFEKAIADLRKCTELAPAFALAHTQLGLAIFRQAQASVEGAQQSPATFEEARRQAEEAVRLAMASCSKGCELDPSNPQSHNYWGELLFAMGDFEAAKGKFREASRADHEFGHALVNLGLCELQAMQTEGESKARKSATAYFNKALEIDTLCVPAHLHLAQLHLAGAPPRGTSAIAACEKAVEQYDNALEKAKVAKHQQSDLIEICQLRVSASAKLEALKQQERKE